VTVSGGKGLVLGNYGQVFQYFGTAPQTLAMLVRTRQFAALVDERSRRFMGREFVFDEVDRILSGADFESGYIVIKGEPGIGKTAIAASLVVRKRCVHHFNIAAENLRLASQFLENVCAQLILRYRLPHQSLPPRATEDSGFLSQLLVEAAQAARDAGDGPVIVVVDALDEADRTTSLTSANRLFLPRALPPGVFFIVTAREENDFRLDVDHRTDIWIRDDDATNIADVRRFVRGYLNEHAVEFAYRLADWALSEDDVVTELVKRSEGNFMYLVYVLPDLACGRYGLRDDVGGSALPIGLRGYYQRHWRDMKAADSDRFTNRQRPVLCFLAVGREPMTLMQLVQWTSLEPGEVKDVVDEWREFLNEDPTPPPHFRLYHRSFAEFLDGEENLRWYHDRIAQVALDKITGSWL
jgi:hypothetical protein